MLAIPCWIGYTPSMKSRKREIMTEFEKQCYGMTTAAIREQYMESFTAKRVGLEMVVMGILSDVQELTSYGNSTPSYTIRKQLNIAKYILSEMLEEKSTQVA
jgi:hypothetical protein